MEERRKFHKTFEEQLFIEHGLDGCRKPAADFSHDYHPIPSPFLFYAKKLAVSRESLKAFTLCSRQVLRSPSLPNFTHFNCIILLLIIVRKPAASSYSWKKTVPLLGSPVAPPFPANLIARLFTHLPTTPYSPSRSYKRFLEHHPGDVASLIDASPSWRPSRVQKLIKNRVE